MQAYVEHPLIEGGYPVIRFKTDPVSGWPALRNIKVLREAPLATLRLEPNIVRVTLDWRESEDLPQLVYELFKEGFSVTLGATLVEAK